jgi:hypothetical protein
MLLLVSWPPLFHACLVSSIICQTPSTALSSVYSLMRSDTLHVVDMHSSVAWTNLSLLQIHVSLVNVRHSDTGIVCVRQVSYSPSR